MHSLIRSLVAVFAILVSLVARGVPLVGSRAVRAPRPPAMSAARKELGLGADVDREPRRPASTRSLKWIVQS
jgi:hypothetical protein